MLRFALKNMAIKKVQMILVVLSIVLSAGIGVLAYNVASQVDDGITQNAGYYSVIVGPSGSQTQLAMNTMYFTDQPLGPIPYSVVTELQMDGTRITSVIPFAMADSYNGFDVVGTTAPFLKGKTDEHMVGQKRCTTVGEGNERLAENHLQASVWRISP